MEPDGLLPPNSAEAEQAVLGALLTTPSALARIEFLHDEHFYRLSHRLIFRAARALIHANEACDVVLVAEKLGDKALEEVGGHAYLGTLVMSTPSAANIAHYAKIVRDHYQRRQCIVIGTEIASGGYRAESDPNELWLSAEEKLHALYEQKRSEGLLPFHRTLDDALQYRENFDVALSTGFPDLDRYMPLRAGELIVIAGRPSMGKSALACNIAEHVAARNPVSLFSMEMSRAAIGNRILSWHARSHDNPEDRLMNLLLYIETPALLTPDMLRMKVRHAKRAFGCDLVIVDYLGMMRGTGENRTQQIGSVSRGLKAVAIECNVPVIAVSQLNRANEGRNDRRPLLSDLRESGDIEQDADIVAMVYRDEYYNHGIAATKGMGEILVRKNRNGPVGTVNLTWINEYARFENYAGPPIKPTSNVRTMDFAVRKKKPEEE